MSDVDRPRTAVALHYDGGGAPVVTAKGQGPLAEKIVEIAQQSGVTVEENAALAEALSTIDIDEEIPVELYQAVAQVISYVMRAAEKTR